MEIPAVSAPQLPSGIFTVGVVGASNVGKSTFLNALLGRKLMPSASRACTAVLAHCLLDIGGEPFILGENTRVTGTDQVREHLKDQNEKFRAGGSDRGPVGEVTVHTGACTRMAGIVDGSMRFVDVPGYNESGRTVVAEANETILSLCHGLLVLVRYSEIESRATADLINKLEDCFPHLFAANSVSFIITQVDELQRNDLDDDGVTDIAVKIASFKTSLRFLSGLARRAQDFMDTAPIFATGVNRQVIAETSYPYDWLQVIDNMVELHRRKVGLIDKRKRLVAQAIYATFRAEFNDDLFNVYPEYAQFAITQRERQVKKTALIVVLGAGAMAAGGWVAYGAWAARAAALGQVATATATAAAADAAAIGIAAATASATGSVGFATVADCAAFWALGGLAAEAAVASAAASAAAATTTATAATAASVLGALVAREAILVGGKIEVTPAALGCRGVVAALESVSPASHVEVWNSEKDGEPSYVDYLTWPGTQDKVLYVGHFKGKMPHGSGILFWKESQTEAFQGEFKHGEVVSGIFINHRAVVIGGLAKTSTGDFEVSGFQPDSMFEASEPCAVCLENPRILSEGRLLDPCNHGCVCASCLSQIQDCPVCRAPIKGTKRFQ